MTLVFTLCSNNYLAQANTLGQSLLAYNPFYIFKIGLVDKKDTQIDYASFQFEIIEVESIGIEKFDEMVRRYSITELNTAVKPFYFQYFFKNEFNVDNVIFLDPDILVYKAFSELEEILEDKEIVVTPHFTTSLNDDKILTENDFLNTGLYNLGFIALKKGKESLKFIEWWSARLATKAYIDFANGMFTDQIWINFVPLFFSNVEILKHPGYNMAYWNLHERSLNEKNEICFKGKFYPLVFFHFSGYNPLKSEILSKYQNRYSFENMQNLIVLFREYSEKVFSNNYNAFIQYPCYYDLEKKRIDLEAYMAYKRSVPVFKRIFRGIILRMIKCFRIDIAYYTH